MVGTAVPDDAVVAAADTGVVAKCELVGRGRAASDMSAANVARGSEMGVVGAFDVAVATSDAVAATHAERRATSVAKTSSRAEVWRSPRRVGVGSRHPVGAYWEAGTTAKASTYSHMAQRGERY